MGRRVVDWKGVQVLELADVRECSWSEAPEKDDRPYALAVPRAGEPVSVVLGRRLRWLRVERGLSRKQVAERLRVPVEHVEGHERGIRRIDPRDLVEYARLFRARISDFFKEPPTDGSG
jgi:DNA-binding transcriptional regulator YiaG